MKTPFLRLLVLGLILSSSLRLVAQEELDQKDQEPVAAIARPPEQLDQLFGPIALYPDALVALILPAATFPSDVVLAARYLEKKGDPEKIDRENWDDSVKALVHYPEVVKWMDDNLNWTKQAGEAFLAQPVEVMNAVQRLRAKARAAGTLIDTPQQQILVEAENIRIVPAQPDVIYVPRYDPEIVYVSRSGYYHDPFLTFGAGFATGLWLGYDLDWGHRRIWTVDRHYRDHYWRQTRDWRRPSFPGRPGYVEHAYRRPWQPSPGYHRPPRIPSSSNPNRFHSNPGNPSFNGNVRSPERRPDAGSGQAGVRQPRGDRGDRPSHGDRPSPSPGERNFPANRQTRNPQNPQPPAIQQPANAPQVAVQTPAPPANQNNRPQSFQQPRGEWRQDRSRPDRVAAPAVERSQPPPPQQQPARSEPSSDSGGRSERSERRERPNMPARF